MPSVGLSLIRPNPFRDFDLHPIDKAQVQRLRASIKSDGFWTGVVARRVGNNYQIAFGHHRIEAARQEGLDSVPIEVRDLDDVQMVRMLASENATQRGSTAAATIDAVAAISKMLAYNLWRCDEERFVRNLANLAISYPEARGRLEAGSGIGRTSVLAFAPKDAFSRAQLEVALSVLKDSGRMATIVADARARADAEIAAEAAAVMAVAAKPVSPAAQRTSQPSSAPEPIFDVNCARLFRNHSHLAEFRRIVTSEGVRSYLPVEKQFGFAQQIIAELGDQELTAIKLRERANVIFYEELGMPRSQMRGSPLRMSGDREQDALNRLQRCCIEFERSCAMLGDLFGEERGMSAYAAAGLDEITARMNTALRALQPKRQHHGNHRAIRALSNGEDANHAAP